MVTLNFDVVAQTTIVQFSPPNASPATKNEGISLLTSFKAYAGHFYYSRTFSQSLSTS